VVCRSVYDTVRPLADPRGHMQHEHHWQPSLGAKSDWPKRLHTKCDGACGCTGFTVCATRAGSENRTVDLQVDHFRLLT